jgi:hypothetical protein
VTINLEAYLRRIGFAVQPAPTLSTLRLLNALHPQAIAFENLLDTKGPHISQRFESALGRTPGRVDFHVVRLHRRFWRRFLI